jgi:putative CocE/NonD family hydrolase
VPNAWIPLSDGCRLSARAWLPEHADAAHPVPAILEYLPYRKDDATAAEDASRHPYFAAHGFASVRVDLRGTGDSDGVCLGEYLPAEQADALEVLSWLEEQEWCTGQVGMIGYSWGGFNGLQVAALRPPQLAAIVTLHASDDRYADDCHYAGGCLLGGDMLKWASWMLAFNARPPDPAIVGSGWLDAWLERLDATSPYLDDWLAHQRRDGFWRQGSIAENYSAIEVPVLAVGGWADAYTNAVPRLLEHLSCPRRAIIGPWGHIFPERGVPGPAIGFLQECVRWFEQWLLGRDTGVMDEPPLRAWIQESLPPADFYAERPGRWVAESAWPPPTVQNTALVLTAPGAADSPGGLVPAFEGENTRLELPLDQSCGLAAGVWCANGLPAELAIDQGHDDDRSLLFDTAELVEPLELLGRPVVRLAIDTSEPQGLLAVRLCAVAPDGASTLISWGALNLTHRGDHEWPAPLVPGNRYDIDIELNTVGERVPSGYRLRLAVSSAYWPQLWPSPRTARVTLIADGISLLELPVHEPGRPAAAESAALTPEFLPAENSAALNGGIVQRTDRTRTRAHDVATGAATIEDVQSYQARISATGTDYAHIGTDRWTVLPGNPLSARADCLRTVTIDREGWHVRVETQSALFADAEQFFLENEVVAFDGDREVFRRQWRTTIPRDQV